MKKIALLLAFALAFATVVTAADVSVGGWLDSRGGVITRGGDDNKDNDDPKLYVGSQEFEVAAAVTGDNFGARIGLIHWSGDNGQWSGYKTDEVVVDIDGNGDPIFGDITNPGSGVASAPFIHNSYIYVDMLPSMVRLYAGVQMFAFGNYTSYAVVDGYASNGPIAHWSDPDAFGFGLGAYNYASNPGISKKPTGLALEITPIAGLSLLAILDVESQIANANEGKDAFLLEDVVENNLHFNVKYAHDLVTVYAGTHLKKDNNASYVEASIKALDGLTSDIKFEYIDAKESDDVKTAISANLGYDLGAVAIASEINQYFQGGDASETRATSQTVIGLSVAPVVPVVNLKLKGLVSFDDRDDSDVTYTIGTVVSKPFGQANTNLGIRYDLFSEDNNAFTVDWKLTCWF